MTDIYVIYDIDCMFFSSFEKIIEYIGIDLSKYSFIEKNEEGCYFEELDFTEACIRKYTFQENEEISFMECTGPSSECCFLVKKSSFEFYTKMLSYMNSLIFSIENGDRIDYEVFKLSNNYSYIRFSYKNGNDDTDLMKFGFYNNIKFS